MNLEALAQQLVDGKITVAQWQAAMREYIRIIHVEAAAIAMGGRQNVTQSQWGYIGSLIKKQYAYLDNFVQDILNNPQAWLNGRLLVRMQLYERAQWGTYEQVIRRQMEANGYDEERRVLGMADHCFVTGTLVKTPSRDKPIEKIRIGEYVVTRFGNKMVTRTFVNDYYGDLLNVSSGENSVITTKNHPFLTDNGWKRADNLSCLDNTVIFENGAYVLRRHVTIPHALNSIPAKVYNLEIEDVHEYIANNFVVHNCNGCLEQASLGWQPIGTLDPIGAEECLSNCHCVFEYRKNDMLFAPRDVEKASEMLFAPALE